MTSTTHTNKAVLIISPRRIFGLFVALALVVFSLVGFGGSHAVASPTTTTTTFKFPSGTVLNVGDQEQFLESALQDSGALKGAHYKVNFVEFDSGPLVNAGFAAHQIDVGFMGDLPAALAAT